MEDPSLDFSSVAFSHQVPPQWGIPYSLLVLQTFSLFSRLNNFTESHLLWMRIWELPVHTSASKFTAQLHLPQLLSEHAFSESILKLLIRQSQTLCSLPTVRKQHLSSLTTCCFQFTFKNPSFWPHSFSSLINFHSLKRNSGSLCRWHCLGFSQQ